MVHSWQDHIQNSGGPLPTWADLLRGYSLPKILKVSINSLPTILEISISGLPKNLDIYSSSLTAFAMHSC